MEKPRVAMILAAGRGERMRPLTDATPKPLLRVQGVPLIERHVRGLVAAGLGRIVINLAWLGAQIREYLGDGARFGAQIAYSEEAPEALQPAGGIFRALPLLSPGPFAVVNGDILTDYPFATLAIGGADDAHLVMVANPSYLQGDFGIRSGRAIPAERVSGETAACASGLYTFSGIGVYRPDFFHGCADGAFPLKPLMLRSMAASRCSAELYAGKWEDVGTPERLQALNASNPSRQDARD
jgi:N-acetyl-alpha-D-muramate 1-phosphate uridylyltransferase